jgi:8-amino-3,8-dideoxy-alpha-D-manno-octulosonate transaminase
MKRLFSTLSLEINALCNRHCVFCPVAYNTRPDDRMSEKLLDKAINELDEMNYRGRVELYIYSEPCKDMEWLLRCLREFRKRVPRVCLMVASNGDYLRGAANIVKLYEAGLNQLIVNCYSPGLYEKRQAWIAELPADVERNGELYSYVSPRKRIVQLMDKSVPAEFGKGIFRLQNRAGNIVQFLPETTAPLERMCVKPFRLLNVDWKGRALICCNDYHAAHSFGNLKDLTLVQLWNHPVMNSYRRELFKKNRNTPMCKTCDCHSGAYPHLVEKPSGPYAKELT